MKEIILAILVSGFLQVNAQGDTIYVDQNNNTYINLPSGFFIIDTNDVTEYNRALLSLDYSCTGPASRVLQDSLNTFCFASWELNVKNSNIVGTYYFLQDSILLDSIYIDSSFSGSYFSDTSIVPANCTLTWGCKNTFGNDTITNKILAYHIRTEIRIAPISTELSESASEELNLFVYPNPTQSTLFFSNYKLIRGTLVRIFDIRGKMVKSQILDNEQIDISSLKNGIYLISIPELNKTTSFQKR